MVHLEGRDSLPPDFQSETLRVLAAGVLAAEGQAQSEMTLLFCDDELIRDLNARFRDADKVTDVLSFPAQESTERFVQAPTALHYIGDVAISVPQARRQAEDAGQSLEQELRLLVVHGTLHLMGYDHAAPEEQQVMWARQEALLDQPPADWQPADDYDDASADEMSWRSGVLASFGYAAAGMRYLVTTQRSFRIQIAAGLLAIILAAVLGLNSSEWALLVLTIGIVLVAEMFNSVVEASVDAVIQTYHPLAKVAKDVAAGAVLFASLVAVVIGLLLLGPKLWALLFG